MTIRAIDLNFGTDDTDPSVQALWDGVVATVVGENENLNGEFLLDADIWINFYQPGASPQSHTFDLTYDLTGVSVPFQQGSLQYPLVQFTVPADPFNASNFVCVNASPQGMRLQGSTSLNKLGFQGITCKLTGPSVIDGKISGYMRVSFRPIN